MPRAETMRNLSSFIGINGVRAASINTTKVGNVGGGEDDLMSFILSAGKLSRNGAGLKVKAWGKTANNANAKTLKLLFGSTTILTTTLTTGQAGLWEIEALVFRTGVDAQDAHAKSIEVAGNNVDIEQSSPTEDDGAAITVKVTGTGVADDDIEQEGMLVELLA